MNSPIAAGITNVPHRSPNAKPDSNRPNGQARESYLVALLHVHRLCFVFQLVAAQLLF